MGSPSYASDHLYFLYFFEISLRIIQSEILSNLLQSHASGNSIIVSVINFLQLPKLTDAVKEFKFQMVFILYFCTNH